jgi:hypothetical protein
MKHLGLKVFSSLLALQSLTACSESMLETPGINYIKSGPVPLNVQDIQIVSIPEVQVSKNKHAQEEAKYLRAEIEKWARSRFSAQGGVDRAVITLEKVTVRVLKDTEKDISRGPRDFYEGIVEVKIDILDEKGFAKGSVSAFADQKVGIPQTYTYHEKQAQLKRLREELINSIDAKVVKEISRSLIPYMMQ